MIIYSLTTQCVVHMPAPEPLQTASLHMMQSTSCSYSYSACAVLDVLLKTQPLLKSNQVRQAANMHVGIVNFSLLYASLHVEVLPAHQADAGQILVVSYIHSEDYLLHEQVYSECSCSSNVWAAHQW